MSWDFPVTMFTSIWPRLHGGKRDGQQPFQTLVPVFKLSRVPCRGGWLRPARVFSLIFVLSLSLESCVPDDLYFAPAALCSPPCAVSGTICNNALSPGIVVALGSAPKFLGRSYLMYSPFCVFTPSPRYSTGLIFDPLDFVLISLTFFTLFHC